jgi:hypothetical protein
MLPNHTSMRLLLVLAAFLWSPAAFSQAIDSLGTFTNNPETVVKSPFKALNMLHAVAVGHKSSGTVDVAFTMANQSTGTAAVIFNINQAFSKAADDQDSLYTISQVRLGDARRDSDQVYNIVLRPGQSIHLGFYLLHVATKAQYIQKMAILLSLAIDDIPQGADLAMLYNVKITWR